MNIPLSIAEPDSPAQDVVWIDGQSYDRVLRPGHAVCVACLSDTALHAIGCSRERCPVCRKERSKCTHDWTFVAPGLDPLHTARLAYTQALERLWAASDANTAAWNAYLHGETADDSAWREAALAEESAQTAEREAWFAWRNTWRQQNGWA